MQQRTRQTTPSRTGLPAYRAGWLRFVFALCASFIAVGHLAALAHMTFVAHARCAEHGQLVHVEPRGRDAAQDLDAPAGEDRVTEGGAPSSDEHDHCIFGTAQASHARVAQAGHRLLPYVPPPAAEPLSAPLPARALVAPPPPIELLFLSPKSSPPA